MLPHPTPAPYNNRTIGYTTSFKVLRRGVVRGCFRAACELRRIHKPYDAAAQEAQAIFWRMRKIAVSEKAPPHHAPSQHVEHGSDRWLLYIDEVYLSGFFGAFAAV